MQRATGFAPTLPRLTTSAISLARTSSSRSVQSCLIRGFLDQNGIHVEPTALAVWAVPPAICAFVIHGARLLMLDRSLTQATTATEAVATEHTIAALPQDDLVS